MIIAYITGMNTMLAKLINELFNSYCLELIGVYFGFLNGDKLRHFTVPGVKLYEKS